MSKNFELLQRVAKDQFFDLPEEPRPACPEEGASPRFRLGKNPRTTRSRNSFSGCSHRPARAAGPKSCLSRGLRATTEAAGFARGQGRRWPSRPRLPSAWLTQTSGRRNCTCNCPPPNQIGLAEALTGHRSHSEFCNAALRAESVADPLGFGEAGLSPFDGALSRALRRTARGI